MLFYILALLVLLLIITWAFMQHPKFGQSASGERLAKMQQAANYKDGTFQNINITPSLTEGYTFFAALKDFLFQKGINTTPDHAIKHIDSSLSQLKDSSLQYVWFGHSSYLINAYGQKFLIDPVLSGNASPVPGSVKAFEGSNTYLADQLPAIDYLIITHDHFDHLDYETIMALKAKVNKVICPLGVGAHFEHWGFKPDQLIEHNWHEAAQLDATTKITFTPARHFSGRTFKRNTTLWTSYVLEIGTQKIFIGGDSGYDTHFKSIGEQYGPMDWVILENGQYNKKWRYIHALPEEQLNIISDLKAKNVITVHHAKFKLAQHAWNEPLIKIKAACDSAGIHLATPQIGAIVNLNDSTQTFTAWWE